MDSDSDAVVDSDVAGRRAPAADAAELTLMISDYVAKLAEARAEFREDAVVAYQNGSFYEFFGSAALGLGAPVERVAEALRVRLYSRGDRGGDWQACGVPVVAFDRYCCMLTDAGYTVVRYDQVPASPASNGARGALRFERVRTRVFSRALPPAGLTEDRAVEKNVAVVFAASDGETGYASLDTVSGRTRVTYIPAGADAEEAFSRLLAADAPLETEVMWVAGEEPPAVTSLRRSLTHSAGAGVSTAAAASFRRLDIAATSRSHVSDTLRRVFGDEALGELCRSPDAFLGVRDRWPSVWAFCGLLDFVYRRDEGLLGCITRPGVLSPDAGRSLLVTSDGLTQLQAVDARRNVGEELLACKTAPGRREMRARLSRPSARADVINGWLDAAEELTAYGRAAAVRRELDACPDIDLIRAQMSAGTMRLDAWPRLAAALSKLIGALRAATGGAPGLHQQQPTAAQRQQEELARVLLDHVRSSFDLSATPPSASDAEPPAKLFGAGVCEEYDAAHARCASLDADVASLVDALNACCGCLPGGEDRHFKTEYRIGRASVSITEARLKRGRKEIAKRAFPAATGGEALVGASIVFAKERSRMVITGPPAVVDLLRMSADARDAVAEATSVAHAALCRDTFARFGAAMSACSDALARIDVAAATARMAENCGFVRPTVLDDGHSATFEATALRHPIAERTEVLHTGFVPNDVALLDGKAGVLLFGVNGSGKSCLMKSVGLAVVMAQAGLYVAADALRLRPFEGLTVRVKTGDDVRLGRSTFTNEMIDVRHALAAAGPRWLVIGDELCSGTNHVDGCAIVAAGIKHFQAAGAKFLFATHLLSLPDVACVRALQGLRIMHMHCRRDRATGALVYERSLREGRGDVAYGVEVCRGLDMPSAFLEDAMRVKRELCGQPTDGIVELRASRYNAAKTLDRCEVCRVARATATHHIEEQAGRPSRRKNLTGNLMGVCQACHDSVHDDGKPVRRVWTSRGAAIVDAGGEVDGET